jgi:hypothetical protein
VKVWLKKIYFKIYLANEKIINNEFGHKLCWDIVAQWKGVLIKWSTLSLDMAKEKTKESGA